MVGGVVWGYWKPYPLLLEKEVREQREDKENERKKEKYITHALTAVQFTKCRTSSKAPFISVQTDSLALSHMRLLTRPQAAGSLR